MTLMKLGLKKTLIISLILFTTISGGYYGYKILQPAPPPPNPIDPIKIVVQKTLETANKELPLWITNQTQFIKMSFDEDQKTFVMHLEIEPENLESDLPAIKTKATLNTEMPDGKSVTYYCENDEDLTLNTIKNKIVFIDPKTKNIFETKSLNELLCS